MRLASPAVPRPPRFAAGLLVALLAAAGAAGCRRDRVLAYVETARFDAARDGDGRGSGDGSPSCPCNVDLDHDNEVGLSDLSLLLACFEDAPSSGSLDVDCRDLDIDCSGVVDGRDLEILNGAFGRTAPDGGSLTAPGCGVDAGMDAGGLPVDGAGVAVPADVARLEGGLGVEGGAPLVETDR